ncbi:hypothetical protein BTA51_24355 [Hahella sp. CCB-MM4]|uniref:chorismate--pyruvate lyase family protein n=1 Tax=Hahella sp. (strain CCB-MM4) TaxID=1926491 RepID=UPI000B9B5C9C|nr:chorismate pyruvate-lyase family protein [Hahella sp. CCB-MM4]OZG70722.1 hypothetical protein BTA51_24355 [Hahella sp. CCB-MM4]
MIKISKENLRSQNDQFELEEHLSILQRILLNSDGTMTNLLEEMLQEDLYAHKIFEDISPSTEDLPMLALTEGQPIWRRMITLQGKHSGLNYLYADSLIAQDNLDKEFADTLLNTGTPIGKIWELFRVETYKSLDEWGEEPAGNLADLFSIDQTDMLLFRTYRVFSQKKPVMQITEKFPKQWFLDGSLIRKQQQASVGAY